MKLAVTLAVLSLACAPVILGAGTALAKEEKLSPAKVKLMKKTRKSFEACRKDALKQFKQGTISKPKFEVALNACTENFPGASLYITCKKSAIKTATSKQIAPEAKIEECKRFLLAASYDETNPVPYFVDQGMLYFAGIGMNRQMPIASLTPPNFDCEKVETAADDPANAQYLLFGNHPRMFAGLSELKGQALIKALGLKKPSEKGVDVKGYGRVYSDPKTASGMVFFPAASCDFNAEPGDVFAGLSAYYLLDKDEGAATPYFGIAYYKQGQSKISTRKLVESMVKALGGGFKAYKKNAHTAFVAAAPVSEIDDEQDPKNLCKQPRQHRFVGVVQSRKEDADSPEYVVLANVKNLCDYGDKQSQILAE